MTTALGFNEFVATGDGAGVRFTPIFFEQLTWRCDWHCEQWSEELVEFARRKLERMGIEHLPEGMTILPDESDEVMDAYWSRALGLAVAKPRLDQRVVPTSEAIPSSYLRHLRAAEMEIEVLGNLLLNEGIQLVEDLAIGAGGTTLANANAQLGVGDSTTAEAATQTDLQAGTNFLFVAMNATFPTRASQTLTFTSDFTSGQANFAWQEMSVRNGAAANKNLNRKVTSLGTKATGTWTLTGTVAIS